MTDEVTAVDNGEASLEPGDRALRALIVDDHQMIRETLSRYLSELDVAVVEAEDFVSAFAAITRQPDFDLAILDIRMPGVDGLTTLATLRRLFPGLRVAILSGSIDLLDMSEPQKTSRGVLPKSMDRQPLVNALRGRCCRARDFSPLTCFSVGNARPFTGVAGMENRTRSARRAYLATEGGP
jgi:CheY-like chemotaxis protein